MRNDFTSDYLMHHGIQGQKWGVRNGPPYPLDSKAKSSSEKKSEKKSFHLTDKQKRVIKIGAAVAGTVLITYGAYKLKKSGLLDNAILAGKIKSANLLRGGADIISRKGSVIKDAESKIYNKKTAKFISDFTGLKLKEKPGMLSENLAVNRGKYVGGKNDPRRNNCSHSVYAWILNEIGLDVKALPMPKDLRDGGITSNEFKAYFTGAKFKQYKPTAKTVEEATVELKRHILEAANGQDGAGAWRMTSETHGGHFMGWKIENGEVILVNPQIESDDCKVWLEDIADGLVGGDGKIDVFGRLDNIAPNLRKLKIAVENA